VPIEESWQMAAVFINYRTNDERGTAVLLKRELSRVFGEDSVFMASMIPPGRDFEQELLRRVRGCEVILVLVGHRWLTAQHSAGGRAIDHEDDWVRREIAEAFACGSRAVPILVNDTPRLTSASVPADIEPLTRCQHLRLRHDNIESDLARIIDQLVEHVPTLRRMDTRPARTPPSVHLEAHASDHARVHQSAGDQVIWESGRSATDLPRPAS
jgi:TIR domain